MGTTDGDHREIIDLRAPADVCVIGSGLAGLVVATHLIRRDVSVTVLERATDLTGRKPEDQRGLRYGHVDPGDTAERSWIAGSGWPLDFEELEPWFRQAHKHFAIGNDHLIEHDRSTALGSDFLNNFDARWFQFGSSDEFRLRLVEELAESPLCRIETNAAVVELIRAQRGGEITSVHYRSGDGAGTVEASRFVLACGAIENARLLLASDRGNGGIGNEHGNVGRYFMDHPIFSIGHIEVDDADAIDAMAFFDVVELGTGVKQGYAMTSDAVSEQLRTTRMAVVLQPSNRDFGAVETERRTLSQLKLRLQHPLASPRKRKGLQLDVVLQCEQPPLIDSRVSLAYDNDVNGSPLPRIDWRIGEQVRASVLAVQERLAARVEQSGLGTYQPRSGSFDELGVPSSMAHHMGTTRMSHRPRDGVVTPDARVHNVPNLFVAGGSVFPTSGYVDPTLTVLALAERLADHLATGQSTADHDHTADSHMADSISSVADALSD